MTVTQKDFIAIAKIIKLYMEASLGSPHDNGIKTGTLDLVSKDIADYFQSQNAKFKREKFLKACGVEE